MTAPLLLPAENIPQIEVQYRHRRAAVTFIFSLNKKGLFLSKQSLFVYPVLIDKHKNIFVQAKRISNLDAESYPDQKIPSAHEPAEINSPGKMPKSPTFGRFSAYAPDVYVPILPVEDGPQMMLFTVRISLSTALQFVLYRFATSGYTHFVTSKSRSGFSTHSDTA